MNVAARSESTYGFLPIGFHGDAYLLTLVDALLDRAEVFVETGSNVGTSLSYVAQRRPNLPCLSCEPDPEAFVRAAAHTRHLPNVSLFRLGSVEFLEQVLDAQPHFHERPTLFWLDAHGYGFDWPLHEELEWITSRFVDPLILVDDFQVPGRPEFGWDEYDGQTCSLDYVRDSLRMPYDLFVPAYVEHTSSFHPLRGFGLFTRRGSFAVPAPLRGAVRPVHGPCYAQNAEDAVVLEAFSDRQHGFFVELGCIDGRRFSNTLALEERGWSGVCVEAYADYVELLRTNRPGSTVVHAAVAETDAAEVEFHANSRGSLSTPDPALEHTHRSEYGQWFTGFDVQRVPQRSISSILDELGCPPVDVLSIDVEGTELRALRGLDLARHRPELIVIEANDPSDGDEIDALLVSAGFRRGPRVANNGFYFADAARCARVVGRTLVCDLVHTCHPLDVGADARAYVEVAA